VEQHVDAAPSDVHRAFTGRLALRMWLCTDAQIDPRPEGRLFLWWADGYYAAGEIAEIEPEERIAWRWHGRGEPGPTEVSVTFLPAGAGTKVLVEQTGFGYEDSWSDPFDALSRRWADGLENLASVWSGTGVDLRRARRPLLGIYLGGFVEGGDANLPEGVRGMRITGTVAGSGAEACGLVRGDVVSELNGVQLTEAHDFATARRGKQAGDTVSMAYYRNGERTDGSLAFSAPPDLPRIPGDAADLAGVIEGQNAGFAAELDEILAAVSEAESSRRPAEGTWSVREILAHLILFERCFQQWSSMYAEGEELGAFAATVPARVEALRARCPSMLELSAELAVARAETVALLRGLSEPFVGHPEYVRMGQIMIEEAVHTTFHHDQLRRTIAAVHG